MITMTDSYDNLKVMSDIAVLELIGYFIKQQRLDQNKSQVRLAYEAGISRSTLNEFEKGRSSNTLTLIQLLRALDKLSVLNNFREEKLISPIKLAEMELSKRKRASKSKITKTKKSEW
jgi:transcriptional regulator with XRE-family HTH domain